ncbi:hypothetical protein GLOIN_2v1472033 [Rhizophagus irregularis DAOM 181602=DAOM 197198]|uniref:Uncharacterized protein n=1 Tax=Rhizophagus irregularis (strain DAOM 181602 / DAOM 197198 / MUCL 43194) TaxID=747089 RepID=A0A2P4QQ64_RHIID|nr:hypothetical protein GLOIN_2v1472033 [Rhizophagus irregularis DAOM 181602=DAOM 197198]POG79789.1 hypothetical protein GLOIN_2v1472033 [Rhizophagus irregularis DAOM 181602=DAOM 197198]|eukprot:XP_025186655.1 hypothetical protein GLOIN_2v1472033 [Rhizophagus irregularis DAOM 181602=DAOM 197198]
MENTVQAFMQKNDLEKVWMVRNFKTVYRDGKRNKDKKRIEDKRAANSLHSKLKEENWRTDKVEVGEKQVLVESPSRSESEKAKVQPPGTSLKLQKPFGHFGTDGRNFQDASEPMKCLERYSILGFKYGVSTKI